MSPLYRVGAVVVLLLSPADAAVPKFDGTVVRQGLSDVNGTSATVSADGALVAFVSSARLLPGSFRAARLARFWPVPAGASSRTSPRSRPREVNVVVVLALISSSFL